MENSSPAAWHHAPIHKLTEHGAYMVTAGTYGKLRHLGTSERLELMMCALFGLADEYAWELQAWAVMANHYHFVAISPENPRTLATLLSRLHSETAEVLNRMDGTPGRKVWFQYRDKHLTYPASYFARLKYVHHNPEHHGVAGDAGEYRWCSMCWFQQNASGALKRTLASFKTDRLQELDDF